MALIDIINDNRLATTSAVLGLLAVASYFLLSGMVNVFLYLGIPAIVLGVVCLMRVSEQRGHRPLASFILPIAGIILGILPMILTFLAVS